MRLGLVASLLCLCTVSLCLADPAKAAIRKDLNVPPESLSPALQQVATTYELQVLYPTQVAKDLKTHGAVGFFTPDDALKAVLSGTGLSYKYLDANTVTVFATAAPAGGDAAAADQDQANNTQDNSKEAGKKSSQDFLLAQATPGETQGDASVEKQKEKSGTGQPIHLEEVVVTGSRLARAAKESAQEVQVYTSEQIEQSGQTTVADFLNTIPAVSQASTEGLASQSGGTTVQLHGLPVGTTLVLINGRRVENSGAQGGRNFFDLNSIPLSAVERVEVVSEGSSAIYGSDGIAGVVNVILKSDFTGVAANVKYGAASGINDTTSELAGGKQWSQGAISIFMSYQDRGDLSTMERAITASNDYRSFGGPDNNGFTCNPGNVFSIDGSNLPGVGAPYAAVPAGFRGTPTQQEFAATAGKLNECSSLLGGSLIPASHRTGIFAEGHYDLTSSLQLFSEILFSYVEQHQNFGFPSAGYSGGPGNVAFTVPASNPFNPFGETVGVSGYFPTLNFGQTLDMTYFRPLVGLKGDFPGGWHGELTAYSSQDVNVNPFNNQTNPVAIQNALNSANPTTALNPFIAGSPGSAALVQSLTMPAGIHETGRDEVVNGFLRGPVVQLPAGPLEMVVGAEYDWETLFYDPTTYHRDYYAAFTEARVPILANHRNPQGGDVLAATMAVRYDSYSDTGSKTTPQFGGEWRPTDSLLFRGTYSRAFAAPNLIDLHAPSQSFPQPVNDPLNGNQPVVVTGIFGGNPKLQPETGRSRTFGFVYSSKLIPDFQFSVTRWEIDQTNTVVFLQPQVIVDNANLFPGLVVRGPPQNGKPGPIISVTDPYGVNFGELNVAGLDYQLTYKYTAGFGELSPLLRVTQTTRYTASLVPNGPPTDRLSKANDDLNWAPRWKGTAALGWKLGPYTATVSARYVGSYRDYDPLSDGVYQTLGNFWLSDLNFRYAIGQKLAPGSQWLKNAYLEIGGINVFDKLPQYSNNQFSFEGYDPTQGDIRGRFLYTQLGAKW